MFFSPIAGDRKLPAVATRDIAAVAAGLLSDPSWRGQSHVAVLGPEDLSFDDMARILKTEDGGLLGRSGHEETLLQIRAAKWFSLRSRRGFSASSAF